MHPMVKKGDKMFILNEKSIEWAFKHITTFYDSDFFPTPFEYNAIAHHWSNIKTYIEGIDLDVYSPKSPRVLLAPKPNDNYRIEHQLEPIDSILYTGLIYEIATKVEEYRIPVEKDIVFSYRIDPKPNGSLFEVRNGWNDFLNKAKNLAELAESKYVISADITDFYNQIYTHRINNLIVEAGKSELDEHAVNVEKYLMGLNKKTSRGIPVGPAASVVFSELILVDIDKKILMYTDKFVRYVDDYYIFFRSKNEALNFLHELTKYLYSPHRLVFSSSKTKILDCKIFLEKIYKDEEYEKELIRKSAIKERAEELLDEIIKEEVSSFRPYEHTIMTPELYEIYETEEKFKILSRVYTNMLNGLLENDEIDYGMMRHIVKRATKYRIRSIAQILINNFELLMPVLREIIIYLNRICNNKFIEENISHLEKMWENSFIKIPYVNLWLTYFWYSNNICNYSSLINYSRSKR